MNISLRTRVLFDRRVSEDISYVIRQCVACNTPVSLINVESSDTHNIYLFQANELPTFTFLSMLSIYFDAMSIDVNKEVVLIKLTINFNKDIPFNG